MKEYNIRALVADTLVRTEQDGVFLSEQENAVLDQYSGMDPRDRSFYKKVCDGTYERLIQIDHILDQFSKTPVKKMKPYIRAVLRMSVYQLMWMKNVPDSAVCNEAVKLVASRGMSGLKGYVNAVLRNLARNKDNISYPDPETDPVGYLSVMYSCPKWIVERLKGDWGEEIACEMLKEFMEQRGVSLRLRVTDAPDIEALEKEWTDAGIIFSRNPYVTEGRFVEPSGPVNLLPGYERGAFIVQDTGAMLVAGLGCTGEEHRVIDLCAAPGGKSIHAADIMIRHAAGTLGRADGRDTTGIQGRADDRNTAGIRGRADDAVISSDGNMLSSDDISPGILCLDISESRCRRITENIRRLGLSGMITVGVSDASLYHEEYEEGFDLVIADVPCSGLGVIGHKPDIKYRLKPEDIGQLAGLQRQIIDNAVRYVRPGGRLIYSTCTVTRQENRDQAEYISSGYGFKDITAECAGAKLPAECMDRVSDHEGPGLQIIPGRWRSDGFYIAVFEKKTQSET